MSRWILCADCLKKHLPEGTRQILERSRFGKPAEYQRLKIGVAGVPKPEQRYITVNNRKVGLDMHTYSCDDCNAEIKPGDTCAGWSVWTENQNPIAPWEQEYFRG